MRPWNGFASERPDLAGAGRELLYQHGVGLAYLATLRPDGRPRLHPMCPVLAGVGLFAFIVPSPKQRDLRRDGWYALHSFPCPDNEDAFYLSGRAVLVQDEALRLALGEQFAAERSAFGVPMPEPSHALFALDVDACLLTRTAGHGDQEPLHSAWRDGV